MSVAAKGFALRRRVEGVRARAISTSLTVHILHLEESVNLCVSGPPQELEMRILDSAIDLMAPMIIVSDVVVREGAFGEDFEGFYS